VKAVSVLPRETPFAPFPLPSALLGLRVGLMFAALGASAPILFEDLVPALMRVMLFPFLVSSCQSHVRDTSFKESVGAPTPAFH
jgi:hypothetical protein